MVDLFTEFETYGSGQGGRVGSIQRGPGGPPGDNPFDEGIASAVDERSLRGNLEQPMERKPQEFPILRRHDNTKFRIPGHITHIAVSNHWVSLAVLGNMIYRFDLKEKNPTEVCEIKREDDVRIHKIFQDPKAHHLFVFMETKEAYYVPKPGGAKKPQPRPLSKFKGYLVESVAWNKVEQSDQSTGAVLLGTSSGTICEAFVDSKKAYCNEVYRLMDDMSGQPELVTGLHMEPFPRFGNSNTENKWYVLATTPCRVYQFIGFCNPKAELQFFDFFAYYNDSVKIQFQEIPGSLKDSKLCVWPPFSSRDPPSSFAWLTGAGVYYSTLVFGDRQQGESLFVEKNLIPYSAVNETGDDGKVDWNQKDSALPIGLSLTKFHCVLLYRDKVVAICHLNNKKVFEDMYNVRRHGPLFAMCTDPISSSIWMHSKLNLMTYQTYKEARNVWKIYLDQENFDLAQKYADGNQKDLDTILIRQAENYFKKGQYEDAAIVFSKSCLSFEQVTLKFMQVNKKDALKLFLLRKLQSLTDRDSTQQTMLSTWLTELYLNELGNLNDEGNMSGYVDLQKEFHEFLENPSLRECFEVNSKTMYDLMSSHGATDDVIYFAKQMNDYDRVITHYIQQYKYEEALQMLSDQAKKVLDNKDKGERRLRFQKFASLYYKFSPLFVKHIPKMTVESWIAADRYLDPKRLIPALIQCNQPGEPIQKEQNNAAIAYLEFCIDVLNSDVTSVHNFLISSYANSSDLSDHKKLQQYLIEQSQGGLTPNYDPQYALRLCLDKSLDGACVYIYSAMGLYEESVSLALESKDVELAQRMIENNPMIRKDIQLQKKLWLKIAEHVIKKEKNITKAMKFLNDCHVLKIEDVLPFFSDVVTIDQFKDAICDSLQSYNTHIDQLKKEMEGATESAKNIRSDIQEIRNKSVVIKSDQKCNVCKGRLLAQPFYMFPCRHSFHRDCLVNEVTVIVSPKESDKIRSLVRSLDNEKDTKSREDSKSHLDQLIASDCPYCGLTMIRSLSIPLLPFDQLDQIVASWK